MSHDLNADRLAIREIVENWVLWRDSADWERFATVWHPDGWMTATWFQGPARDFIEVSREGFNKGVHPVDPAASVKLDAELLARFPEGYCHLAYLQSKNGFKIKQGLPGLRGPEVERLYAEGSAWLAGSPRPGEPL